MEDFRRVALVTGCGKRNGIGAAIARTLSRDGFALVVTDIDPVGVRDSFEPASTADPEWRGVDSLVAELVASGGVASAATGDIASVDDAVRMVGHAREAHGRLDVLVNNAGAPFSMAHGDIESIDPQDWDRAYAINVRGTFLMCRAAAPLMRAQKWGRIVNIASVAARTGSKGNSAYASSKAAVIALTQSLALDLGPAGVTANAILPGFILTTRSLTGMSKRLGKAEIDDATIAATVPPVPLGRAGTPEDVAGTVSFLASEASSYTSGQCFIVDGGICALMRAAVLHAAGPPDAFLIEEVPVPAVGPDDVLVRVRACGVSYRDVVERNGTYRRDVSFPLIIGLEISGTVEQVGSGVRDLAAGQHVCSKAFSSCGDCRYCRSGRETTCRRRRPVRGGYAEYVSLPQDAWVAVPDGVSFEQSCSLGPGAGVALNAVRDTARVTLGDQVLVTGATGGVGLPAVEIARQAGARVIALSRHANKRDALLASGAHEVVVIPPDGNFAPLVRELTDGDGVDVVIDTVGSKLFDAAYDSLALHGRYAFVGQLDGGSISINPARIFFKRAALLGVGSVSRVQLTDVIAMVAAGRLHPRIATVLPLDEVATAHRLVEAGSLIGRIILKP